MNPIEWYKTFVAKPNPGASNTVGTGGSRNSLDRTLSSKGNSIKDSRSLNLGGNNAPSIRNYTKVEPVSIIDRFKQEYGLNQEPNPNRTKVKATNQTRARAARRSLLKDQGARIRGGGDFGARGVAQGGVQAVLMGLAGNAGDYLGRNLADPLTDATIRALDATVGLTDKGRAVDYDPSTNKFVLADSKGGKGGEFDRTRSTFPTTAELRTIKPSRDYQKEAQSGGGSGGNDGTGGLPDREEGDRVTTSPTGKSSAASPTDWKDYENKLNNKEIYLQVDRARGIGNHPTYEQAVKDAKEYDYGSDAGYGGYGTYTGSPDETKYTPTGQSTALGAQTGTSSDADVGDQSRALRIPKGARQQEVFFRQNPNYGQETKTSEPPPSAISVRSRAFLDAPMGVGPKGVMDRTNAAQNIIEGKRGEYAVKNPDGTFTTINKKGYDEIRQNLRNATEFKEEFMRNYVPESPAETQSLHSGAPVPASKMEYNTNFGPTVDTETYGKIVDSTKGMTGIGPIADSEVYGMFLDGREPLMRGPKKDEE